MQRWLGRLRPGAAPLGVLGVLGVLAGVGVASPADALVIVSLDVPETTVNMGATIEVTVSAELSAPIVGFGFDLVYDGLVLSPLGAPSIGPDWMAVPAADGDGLAGAAFPDGLTGTRVLATVTLHADAAGMSVLSLETTAGDSTEGFAFDPAFDTGFDQLASVTPLVINVVPEPTTGLLAVAGLLGLGVAGRRRGR